MSPASRVAPVFGLLAGAALFAVVAGNGLDPASLAQGLSLGAVVAAGPIAVLTWVRNPSTIVALGSGMTIAGAATTPGGNFAGLVLALAGFGVLFAGASRASGVTWRLAGLTLGYAVVLAIGIYAGLSPGIGTIVALIMATAVAIRPKWIPSPDSPR